MYIAPSLPLREPLDFDANCGFIYHSSRRALEKLVCDSPLGRGLVRLTGDLPGAEAAPALSLELDHVPAAAALGMLHTLRSGLAPDLEAKGTISGEACRYAEPAAPLALQPGPVKASLARSSAAAHTTR